MLPNSEPLPTTVLLAHGQKKNDMSETSAWALVAITGLLGSLAGYIIDHSQREKDAGRKLKFHWDRLQRYLLLGSLASIAVFILITDAREPRATDYVWAGLAALKGADILTVLSLHISRFIKSLSGRP